MKVLATNERIIKLYAGLTNQIIDIFFCPFDKIPQPIDISGTIIDSKRLLGDYATVDPYHVLNIVHLIRRINTYLDRPSPKHPLNFLLIAPPGIGKSHFVKAIARKIKKYKVSAITYNMTALGSYTDLLTPIENVRNVKIDDEYPILFLDEFDSSTKNFPLLLPLLWDGEMQLGHQHLKVGKVIIFLAGSNPTIRERIEQSKSIGYREEGEEDDKLPDLLSRINGGIIEIPSLDLQEKNRDRRADIIIISSILLQKRFSEDLMSVPYGLLRFIGTLKYHYGIRSIEYLINLISLKNYDAESASLKMDIVPPAFTSEQAIIDSGLSRHVNIQKANEIIELYASCMKLGINVQIGEIKVSSEVEELIKS